MAKRSFPYFVVVAVALSLPAGLAACDPAPEEPPVQKKRPKLSELQQAGPDMTEEELAEARKKAGFKSQDEIAAENAAMFEKGAKEYIKTRLAEYRDFMKSFEDNLADLESKAPKWGDDAAFEKFQSSYKEDVKGFTESYDALTKQGSEGGETQAVLGKAFRTWEDLNTGLGAGVADNPKFAETLAAIREDLAKVNDTLDEIEEDESLKVDETYEPPKKKKK